MIDEQNRKISKHQYWQDQIKAWHDSNLSQSAFCAQSGIKLSTFSYWRGVLSESKNKKDNKFASVKVINKMANNSHQSIQIKLLTGHIVHLPAEMEMDELAKLIQLLGLAHA